MRKFGRERLRRDVGEKQRRHRKGKQRKERKKRSVKNHSFRDSLAAVTNVQAVEPREAGGRTVGKTVLVPFEGMGSRGLLGKAREGTHLGLGSQGVQYPKIDKIHPTLFPPQVVQEKPVRKGTAVGLD